MAESETTHFDKIQKSLFDEDALGTLSAKDIELRTRYQSVFVVWIENPNWTDKEIVRFMLQEMKVKRTQAYIDLQRIKSMLGNVRNAAKEWQRYAVIEMCKEAYNLAKKRGDIRSMVMAADKLGKYTKLDKDDQDALPWEQLVPPQLDPTSDVSVLKITRGPDFQKKVQQLKNKYLGADLVVEDADVIE